MKNVLYALWCVMLLGGCSTMLPQSHTESTSFTSFEEVRAAFERLFALLPNADALYTTHPPLDNT